MKGWLAMSSILEEFAYGNISPGEQFYKHDSEYGKAMDLLTRYEEKLFLILSEDEKKLFQKYINAQGDVNRLTAVNNFICGYKLGLVMTAEAFVGMYDLTSDEGSSSNEYSEKSGGNYNV